MPANINSVSKQFDTVMKMLKGALKPVSVLNKMLGGVNDNSLTVFGSDDKKYKEIKDKMIELEKMLKDIK